MYPSLFIFAIAFIVRLLNLYLNQINVDTYLIEDQIMYWDWSLKNAYTPNSSIEPNLLLERMPGSSGMHTLEVTAAIRQVQAEMHGHDFNYLGHSSYEAAMAAFAAAADTF